MHDRPALAIDERFSAVARLYGAVAMPRLASARVAVVGLGGVGSWAVEAILGMLKGKAPEPFNLVLGFELARGLTAGPAPAV